MNALEYLPSRTVLYLRYLMYNIQKSKMERKMNECMVEEWYVVIVVRYQDIEAPIVRIYLELGQASSFSPIL